MKQSRRVLRNRPSWTTPLLKPTLFLFFFYTLSGDLAMAQLTDLPRSDHRAVQMDDPKKKKNDHNQKENRGQGNSESQERNSWLQVRLFVHMPEQPSSVSLCLTVICSQKRWIKRTNSHCLKAKPGCHSLCRELCRESAWHSVQQIMWGNHI